MQRKEKGFNFNLRNILTGLVGTGAVVGGAYYSNAFNSRDNEGIRGIVYSQETDPLLTFVPSAPSASAISTTDFGPPAFANSNANLYNPSLVTPQDIALLTPEDVSRRARIGEITRQRIRNAPHLAMQRRNEILDILGRHNF